MSAPACLAASPTAFRIAALDTVAPVQPSMPRLWASMMAWGRISRALAATVGVSDCETTSMDSMASSVNVTLTVTLPPLPTAVPS